jgi:serine/threonine protein kinase
MKSWEHNGEHFILEGRYRPVTFLGSGTYGVVWSAIDLKNNGAVAIKKCKDIFSSRALAQRTLRELKLLRLLDHENIIQIKTILQPINPQQFDDIYIVFASMETDLAEIIRSQQPLSDQHIHYFAMQLFGALRYLHSHRIVHRDIKPRNLLINGDCTLRVADFGLARVYNNGNGGKKIAPMTDYVTTR